MSFFHSLKEKHLIAAIGVITGAIFFVPFYSRSTFYFPFIVPRNIAFRILVEILVLLYIFLVLKNHEFLPKKNIVWILLAGFYAVLTFSSAVNGDFMYSFWSDFERMDGLLGHYHLLAFFFILYCVFREKKMWERLFQVSIAAATGISIVGLSQYLGVNLLLESSGGVRVSSTIGNPTYLAAYLSLHVFMVLYFLLKKRDVQDLQVYKYIFIILDFCIVFFQIRYGREGRAGIIELIFSHPGLWAPFVALHLLAFSQFIKKFSDEKIFPYVHVAYYLATFALFLFLIANTQTRGALVGLGMAAFFSCILLFLRKDFPRVLKAGMVVGVLAAVLSVVWVFSNTEHPLVVQNPLLSRIASISTTDLTTQTRYATWISGWKGFQDKPIFGWGAENFYRVFDKYFPTIIYRDETSVVWFDRPHNILIQYAVEGGIVGLLLYLSFIVLLIYLLIKHLRERYMGILFSACIVAYIGQNLFVFDSINSYIPFFFLMGFFVFSLDFAVPEKSAEKSQDVRGVHVWWQKMQKKASAIAVVSLMGVILALWVFTIVPASENREFLRNIFSLDREPSKENIEALFDVVEKSGYLGKFEMIGLSGEKVMNLSQKDAFPKYQTSEFVYRAEKNFLQALKIHPNDVRLHLFTMVFYLNTSHIDSAFLDKLLALREKALELSPTRAQIYLVTGRAYMRKREFEKGIEEFTRAAELAPDVFEPHRDLFAAYVTIRDLEKARAELNIDMRRLKVFDPMLYRQLAQFYASQKYYDEAEALLEEGTGVYPNTPDIYTALADVYRRQGKKEEAFAAVEKAVSLDPELQAEAEIFKKQIEELP